VCLALIGIQECRSIEREAFAELDPLAELVSDHRLGFECRVAKKPDYSQQHGCDFDYRR